MGYGTDDTRTDLSRQRQSDRVRLERAEARELYRTWLYNKKKVLTPERVKWIEKMYGTGATKRIQEYMEAMRKESQGVRTQ